MTRQIHLLLGVHNHQPVDNWEHVMEEAYARCYKPFLDVLEAHPRIGMSIHYTGYLLDWLTERHPEILAQLRRLIAREQVELIGGAYYEPILAVIPDADKAGQIEKLSNRLEALTGCRPKGFWLAERVWEPHLVKPIAEAGLRYLFLDDSHFMATGLDASELCGRYVTEEQGHLLDVFPVDQNLRYQIPYARPGEIVDYLETLASADGRRAAVYFDDGEKFGVWPGSYGLLYREKWLDRFFTLLEENAPLINVTTPSRYAAQTPPIGRVYLPTASYSEMMAWALPDGQAHAYKQCETAMEQTPMHRRFLRAGFWRHFLVKYPEANNLHKKMLHVSNKVHRLASETGVRSEEALDALWKGQSNDVFWHGVFGGLYLTNLRTANYRHLLRAEQIADSLRNGPSFLSVTERDFNGDGHPEVLIESAAQNLYLDPREGGCLFELDFRAKDFNLLDTLARRHEPYHDTVGKGSNAASGGTPTETTATTPPQPAANLHYDWHRRVSLLDHFLGAETTLEQLSQVCYAELGDFVNQPYTAEIHETGVTLTRDGNLWLEGRPFPVRVEKRLSLPSETEALTRIRYQISNRSPETLAFWFAPEFNVNFLAGDAPDRYYYLPEETAASTLPTAGNASGVTVLEKPKTRFRSRKLISRDTLRKVNGIGLRDEWLGIDYRLEWDRTGDVWRFPVETLSQSETGFERLYQSSAVLPNWRFTLLPGESWQVEIVQQITALDNPNR